MQGLGTCFVRDPPFGWVDPGEPTEKPKPFWGVCLVSVDSECDALDPCPGPTPSGAAEAEAAGADLMGGARGGGGLVRKYGEVNTGTKLIPLLRQRTWEKNKSKDLKPIHFGCK